MIRWGGGFLLSAVRNGRPSLGCEGAYGRQSGTRQKERRNTADSTSLEVKCNEISLWSVHHHDAVISWWRDKENGRDRIQSGRH